MGRGLEGGKTLERIINRKAKNKPPIELRNNPFLVRYLNPKRFLRNVKFSFRKIKPHKKRQ